jgi:hypothetical protein
MNDSSRLDKAFHIIMKRMVETGQAPHYTELAAELGITPREGRNALQELFAPQFPGWLFPKTDYIASFAPFSQLPTQYRITIDGQQKWFAQWGFESLAVCWLFPGKTVRIICPCLDCGARITVEMKDGDVLKREPQGILAYTPVPFREWFGELPFAWSTMNLFRSEEHILNWSGYKPGTEAGIVQLSDMVSLFSNDFFKKRMEPNYYSHMQDYERQLMEGSLSKMGAFWQPPTLQEWRQGTHFDQ